MFGLRQITGLAADKFVEKIKVVYVLEFEQPARGVGKPEIVGLGNLLYFGMVLMDVSHQLGQIFGSGTVGAAQAVSVGKRGIFHAELFGFLVH